MDDEHLEGDDLEEFQNDEFDGDLDSGIFEMAFSFYSFENQLFMLAL